MNNPPMEARKHSRKTLFWIFPATVILLFIARFSFHPHYLKINREQCHTGAIASDILDHGIRFPVFDYLPERYENGIFLEGLAAAPFFAAFGRNFFSLKLLGFITGALTMCVCIWLLRMVAEDRDSAPGFNSLRATIYYFLLTAFGPPMFIFISVSALGDHNEGALAVALIFALYAWRHGTHSRAANFILWCFCGFAVFWEKGSAMAVALVIIWTTAIANHRRTMDPRNFVFGAVAFLVGFSPAIIASLARHGSDIADVTAKFTMTRNSSLVLSGVASTYIKSLYSGFGRNPVLIVAAAISVLSEMGWFLSRFRSKNSFNQIFSTRSMILFFVLGFGIFQIFLTHREITDHFQYWLVLIFYLIASWISRGVGKVESDDRPFVRTVGSSILFVTVVLSTNWNAIKSDEKVVFDMRRDTTSAACYWRFGRAFHITSNNPDRAVEKCRYFDGEKRLQCISGISSWSKTEPRNMDDREAAAYAFGLGFGVKDYRKIRNVCSEHAWPLRGNCAAGVLARIAADDSAKRQIIFDRAAPTAIPCKIREIPFDGIERSASDMLVVLPDKFVSLCNAGSIQPDCGLYLGMCAQTPDDCFSLDSQQRKSCIDVYHFVSDGKPGDRY